MGSVQPNGSAASVSIWFMVFIEPISGAVGAYYDIIRCFRDLIMRCSGCFEADYGVIGVLRACFMVVVAPDIVPVIVAPAANAVLDIVYIWIIFDPLPEYPVVVLT